jgi:hypothetical protein
MVSVANARLSKCHSTIIGLIIPIVCRDSQLFQIRSLKWQFFVNTSFLF